MYAREYRLVLTELVEAVEKLLVGGGGDGQILLMGDFNAHVGDM